MPMTGIGTKLGSSPPGKPWLTQCNPDSITSIKTPGRIS
jgi:hypothetical protein